MHTMPVQLFVHHTADSPSSYSLSHAPVNTVCSLSLRCFQAKTLSPVVPTGYLT